MTVNLDQSAIMDAMRRAAARGVLRGTELVRNEMISLIVNTPKSGRTYRRRGVEHQASAPGEPPASDTGRLVQSIRTTYAEDGLVGTVEASTAYAAPLEYGTQRMDPRPFARPAIANKREEVVAVIEREVSAAVRALSGGRGRGRSR